MVPPIYIARKTSHARPARRKSRHGRHGSTGGVPRLPFMEACMQVMIADLPALEGLALVGFQFNSYIAESIKPSFAAESDRKAAQRTELIFGEQTK